MDLRCGHLLVKMYVKTNELGPVRGDVPEIFVRRSANVVDLFQIKKFGELAIGTIQQIH